MGNPRPDEVAASSDKPRSDDLSNKLATGGLLELVGAPKQADEKSGYWVLDNVVDPFVDASVRAPVRSAAVAAQSIGLNVPSPELHMHKSEGAAGTVQTVSYMAGSMVPYLIAGKLAGSGLSAASKGFLAEGTAAKILTNGSVAQISGAIGWDLLRAPEKNETRLTNAMAGGVAFSAYEAGGLIAARYGINPTAMRAAAGFVGGAGHKLTSSLGSSESVSAKDVLDAGLAGAAFNVVLPKGQELVERTANHVAYLRLPAPMREFIRNPGQGPATEYVGWLGHQNRQLAVGSTSKSILEHGITPVKFGDLSLSQRKALVVDLTRRGAGPLSNPETAASFATEMTATGKNWTDLTAAAKVSDEHFMVVAKLMSENKIAGGPDAKPTKELADAVLKYRGMEKKIEVQQEARGAELEKSLNTWTANRGLPGAKVIVEDSYLGMAIYTPGTGTLKVDRETFNKAGVTPRLTDALGHEYTHLLQDVLHIRGFADRLGIGLQASATQKTQLQELYQATFKNPLSETFLDDVLRLRQGSPLSFWERVRENNLRSASNLLDNDGAVKAKFWAEEFLDEFATTKTAIENQVPWVRGILSTRGTLSTYLRLGDGAKPTTSVGAGGPKGSSAEMLGDVANQLGESGKRLNTMLNETGNSLFLETANKFEPLLYAVRRKAHMRYMISQHEQEAHASGFLTGLTADALEKAGSKAAQVARAAPVAKPQPQTSHESGIGFLTHP